MLIKYVFNDYSWFLMLWSFKLSWLLKVEKHKEHQLWIVILWFFTSDFLAALYSPFSHLNICSQGVFSTCVGLKNVSFTVLSWSSFSTSCSTSKVTHYVNYIVLLSIIVVRICFFQVHSFCVCTCISLVHKSHHTYKILNLHAKRCICFHRDSFSGCCKNGSKVSYSHDWWAHAFF